jgi:hypothetical protein
MSRAYYTLVPSPMFYGDMIRIPKAPNADPMLHRKLAMISFCLRFTAADEKR